MSDDYKVQLTTDGASYSFSIKDTTDSCHGVVFSDQDGVIYAGAPYNKRTSPLSTLFFGTHTDPS